jgi:hypothetical protein
VGPGASPDTEARGKILSPFRKIAIVYSEITPNPLRVNKGEIPSLMSLLVQRPAYEHDKGIMH